MERWLEFLKTITNLKVLVQMLGLTPENEERFWKDLLTLLKSQEHPVVFDDGELTGLIGQVISSADFEDRDTEPFTSELYNTLKELIYNDTNDSFWNESVQQLIKYFIKNIEARPEDKILIPIGTDNEHSIRISDLKAADAGNSFSLVDEDYWVHPKYNIDDRAYDEVRGHDALNADLSNDVAVQFTKEKDIETWIRLLMPQYGRRVLVEDLDRNFWVIAQTISAICAYLFGDENSINKMCEGIAREVSEIWENVLYLWLEIAAITQRKQKDIRVMSLYVPPRDNEHGRKYDDFDDRKSSVMTWDIDEYGNMVITVDDWDSYKDEIVDRIGYLTEDFANQDLCVLPIVRLDNYTTDFYSTEYYPMVLFYSKDTKEWTYKRIKEQIGDTLKDSLIISPRFEDKTDGKKRFTDQIMGQYRTCGFDQTVWPFSKVPSQSNGEENPTLKYIGCLRVKPDITLKENEAEIENLELSVYDTYALTPVWHEGEPTDRDYSFIGKYSLIPSNDDSLVLTYQADSEQAEQREKQYHVGEDDTSWLALKPWYGGEIASWMLETASIISSDNLFNNQAYVLKIGNYLPENGGEFIMASVDDSGTFKYTSMYGNVTRKSGTGRNTKYYRLRWDTYQPENDGGPEEAVKNNKICYAKDPEKRECTYPTKAHIEYDGLIAAKNFIKANAGTVGKNPCFIATTIGLTPWSGNGRTGSDVFWDVSFLPALYFYVPTIESLTGMPKETEGYDFSPYIKTYTENEAIYLVNDQLNADERPDGDGTVYIEENGQKKEVGKIIACLPMNRYESYFRKLGLEAGDDTYMGGSHWRQFYITNNDENNVCSKEDVNGGAKAGGITIYQATFTPRFCGMVEYFDVLRHNASNRTALLWEDQIAKVSEAVVQIDQDGYEQTEEGSIRSAKDVALPWEDREAYETQRSTMATGFQQLMEEEGGEWHEHPENIYGNIEKCVGENASYFHGNTNLNGGYCIYS